MEKTLAILKPEVLIEQKYEEIIAIIQTFGFKVTKMAQLKMTGAQAQSLYEEHKGKVFYEDLVEYMCSSEVIALVLEKQDAVNSFRKLMGSSDLSKNHPSTLRYKFAKNEQSNAVHGSSSIESAIFEIGLIFKSKT